MKSKDGLIAILAVVMLSFSFFAVISADELPTLPIEFYGYVNINGEPAPVGTELVAKISDEARGRILVKEAGKYGSRFNDKLQVNGTSGEIGLDITFWVDNNKALQTNKYEPGCLELLDLSVNGIEPRQTHYSSATRDSVATSGGGGGGGGGGGAPKDSDSDGYSDIYELIRGTNSKDPNNFPGVVTQKPTPAPTVKPASVPTVEPTPLLKEPTATIDATPKPLPDFDALVAISGLLAVAYLLKRKRN